MQGPLREATGGPAELRGGRPRAMERLIEGLIMSGLAMQVSGPRGRPRAPSTSSATCGRWRAWGTATTVAASHGFKVGVGSIAIAALYERLLERDLAELDVDAPPRAPGRAGTRWSATVRAPHTTPGLDEAAVEQSRAKYIDADELAERLELLRERWPALRERLAAAAPERPTSCASSCARPAPDQPGGDRPAHRGLPGRPTGGRR